jgi:hypothetical protein
MTKTARVKVLIVATMVASLFVGWLTPATASPTTQLQNARDELANCRLLTSAPRDTLQLDRANLCIIDAQDKIRLLTSSSSTPPTTPVPTSPTTATSHTASPPPTTTTPATTSRPCATNPSGCGFPDASNTGVPTGTVVTAAGNSTITTPNITIDGKDLGCLTVNAANVTIRNSRIHGQCYFAIRSNSVGLVVQDSEISCENSTGTGVGGKGFVVQRSEISGCENGFSMDADATVADSFIHAMYLATGGHTDGIQVYSGASNIGILHNTIFNEDDGGTSAIISDASNLTNVNIQGNLMAGGAFTLYCPTKMSGAVTNNRISKLFKPKGGEYGPWIHCELASPRTGNVWDETGVTLPF